jgi:hypothetical protein
VLVFSLSVTREVWRVPLARKEFSKVASPVGTCRFLGASSGQRNPVRNRSGQPGNRDCIGWEENLLSARRNFPTSETAEKVIRLGPRLAFMCSGLVELKTARVDVRSWGTARALYGKRSAKGAPLLSMSDLANEFGKAITEQLDELSPEESKCWL